MDTLDFAAWFPEPDELPRPDWKAIREWIRSHSTEEHWGVAWQEIVRAWLDKLAARLGGAYSAAESEHFHLLSELDEKQTQELLRFLEQARVRILRTLAGIQLPKHYGKHVVLRFTTKEQYYRYIAYFDPEGDHAGSGGQFLSRGYMHIAYPHTDFPGADRHVLAHELTHNLLHTLKSPTWLGEALAMLFERDIAGYRRSEMLTRELADEHRAYWNATTIQEFWSGTAFWETKAQKLAYGLARILLDFIVTDIHPSPVDFRDFVLHAHRKDAGEAAARNYLGAELNDLVATFLGPGEWAPRLSQIPDAGSLRSEVGHPDLSNFMRATHRWCSTSLIAAGIALLVCSIGGCRQSNISGGLTNLQPCRLPGIEEELLCGKFTVFENRKTQSGRTIDLNIVVLPAFDQKSKTEPLFDLEGGPGAAATESARFYATMGKEYRRRHDVVLVDQRGTGKSNQLSIPRKKTPQLDLSEMYPVDHVKNMREALEQRADLTQYTTSIAMDDLDDVRAWLGYDRINLFGLSYGTRAVLVYLRQHPEHVRTITLIGVAPTSLKMPMYHSEAADRAMNLLLQQCEQDAKCHQAFPQIRDDWRKVLANLQQTPARVEYNAPDNSAPVPLEIQRDIFAEKIRNFMYRRDTASRIPLIIHQAAQGDFAPFLQNAIGPSIPDIVADGMYLSVTCAEDVPFIDQAEAAKLNADNPFGNYRVFEQTRACSMWPRGQIPPDFRDPVSSNVPALIFSGNFDPVTPPQRGEEVARYLPNSRHVIIPEAGHGVDGLTDEGCLDRIIIDLIDKGEAKNLDVSCVEQMAPPPFKIRDQ